MTPGEGAAAGRRLREGYRFLLHAWECWEANVYADLPFAETSQWSPADIVNQFNQWLHNMGPAGLADWHRELLAEENRFRTGGK